jgi:hypothetical protein
MVSEIGFVHSTLLFTIFKVLMGWTILNFLTEFPNLWFSGTRELRQVEDIVTIS